METRGGQVDRGTDRDEVRKDKRRREWHRRGPVYPETKKKVDGQRGPHYAHTENLSLY